MQEDQLSLDFSSTLNEYLALLRSLDRHLEACCDWSPERIAGVLDLLQRIVICSRDYTSSRARVSTLAAGIQGQRRVSERTINRWAKDAQFFGLLKISVEVRKFGGHRTNSWIIDWVMVKSFRNSPVSVRHGPDMSDLRPDTMSDLRPDTMSDLRPDTMSDLTTVRSKKLEPPPPLDPKPKQGEEEEIFTELIRRLTSLGYANARVDLPRWLASQAHVEIHAILDEYEANRSVLSGPGAIYSRMLRGVWPDPRVRSLQEIEHRLTVQAAQQRISNQERSQDRLLTRRKQIWRECEDLGLEEQQTLQALQRELPPDLCLTRRQVSEQLRQSREAVGFPARR